jgi:hypothetical protein
VWDGLLCGMKPPMYVRPFSADEQPQVETGLRSADAFTVRRCQVVLASAHGHRPAQIARHLGCATQRGRHAIRAFPPQGLACWQAQSRRPKRTRVILEAQKREQLGGV